MLLLFFIISDLISYCACDFSLVFFVGFVLVVLTLYLSVNTYVF